MGDMIDMYRDFKEHNRAVRAKFGVKCPRCPEKRPLAHPTILLPGQRCRVDGHRDPRPALTQEDIDTI